VTMDILTISPSRDRFQNAARYYRQGRPNYPWLLIKRVVELVDLQPSQRVLDLGTGPGFLALDFARYAGEVVGVDPSSEMLKVAAENAQQTGTNVTFIQGSSSDLGPDFGTFHLVTIGRAFHWMDRVATLQALDVLLDPTGAVALFSESYPNVPENHWYADFDAIRAKYMDADPTLSQILLNVNQNDAVLLSSAFGAVERISVLERRATPLERFVDRVLSYGAIWCTEHEPLIDEVTAEVYRELARYARDGIIHEIVEGIAVIARRP
jgi:SAM-dependent methyltransferase